MKNLASIFVFFLPLVAWTHSITYEKCGDFEGVFTIKKLSVIPDPIKLSRMSLNASLLIELHENLRDDTIVKTDVWKLSMFGLKIPVSCVLGAGKCNMELCNLFETFNRKCLREKGTYGVENRIVNIPKIHSLTKFAATGRYHIEIRLLEKVSKKGLGCYIFRINVRS